MPSRNLVAEKNAVDVFAKTKGKLPSSSQDWADVHKMAYPTINDLPDEFKKTEAASYYTSTGSTPTTPTTPTLPTAASNPLPQNSSNIPGLQNDVNAAKTNLDQLSSPNAALNVLQEAIKAKNQTAQAPIGESEIFKQAGVGGFGALSGSLSARGTELATNMADFKNVIGQMAGTYKDMASAALTRYQMATDAYNKEVDRIQKIQDDLRDNEQAIKLAKLQHDLEMDLQRYQRNNPTIGDQITAASNGLEIHNGTVTDPSKGIVSGFNIGSYATDPNHERAVASLVQGMGQFKTLDDVQNYISKKYPNSPVTADMIGKASQKYGVPWEMLVAMMEQDSSLGTAGKGARTFNPGNVGNDDSGNIRNYGSWQAGVDAVADWLNKHRVQGSTSDAISSWANLYRTTGDISKVPKNLQTQVLQAANNTPNPDKEAKTNEILSVAQGLLDDPSLGSAVGPISSRLPTLRGGTADFEANLAHLKSLMTLDNLKLLKGSMSDKDVAFIQSAASALNANMSEEGFKKELKKIIDKVKAAQTNSGGGAPAASTNTATADPQMDADWNSIMNGK